MAVPGSGPIRLSRIRKEVESFEAYNDDGYMADPANANDPEDPNSLFSNSPGFGDYADPGHWSGGVSTFGQPPQDAGPHSMQAMEDSDMDTYQAPMMEGDGGGIILDPQELMFSVAPINDWSADKPDVPSDPVIPGFGVVGNGPARMSEWYGYDGTAVDPNPPGPGPEPPGPSPVGGCTDDYALNYDPDATYDDGSCEYPTEGFDSENWVMLLPSTITFGDHMTTAANGTSTFEEIGIDATIHLYDIDYGWDGIGENTSGFISPSNFNTELCPTCYPGSSCGSAYYPAYFYDLPSGGTFTSFPSSNAIPWGSSYMGGEDNWVDFVKITPAGYSVSGTVYDPVLWEATYSTGVFDLWSYYDGPFAQFMGSIGSAGIDMLNSQTYPRLYIDLKSFYNCGAGSMYHENWKTLYRNCYGPNFTNWLVGTPFGDIRKLAKLKFEFGDQGLHSLTIRQELRYMSNCHGNDNDDDDCPVFGTKILMDDGTEKNIEDVRQGDYIQCVDLQQYLAQWEKGGKKSFLQHQTKSNPFFFNANRKNMVTRVTRVKHSDSNDIYTVNEGRDSLSLSSQHPVIVKDGTSFIWKQVRTLCVGDYMLYHNKERGKKVYKHVKSIKRDFGNRFVATITCEARNYIADGYVVHNKLD